MTETDLRNRCAWLLCRLYGKETVPSHEVDEVVALVRECVKEERQRAATLVEQYDKTNDDGEFVRPGLAYYSDRDCAYVPDAEAIANAIREVPQ